MTEIADGIRTFLAQPAGERAPHRLGKGKLHSVYRVALPSGSFIAKVKGRETLRVRLVNKYKGVRHFATTGEITRMTRARVDDRWHNEIETVAAWQTSGLAGPVPVPYPDDNVQVFIDAGFGTLSEHLRSSEDDKFKRFSLMEVAGIMFARHTMISALSNQHLFHEEPHTANLLYRPGELVYIDQEFLPDDSKPDIHHAASELIALAQSAIRDLDYQKPEEIVAAIAHGYPDPQTLETVARLLDVRRLRWRFLGGRSPVSSERLATMFRTHAIPEERNRPAARPVDLGMPGNLAKRPDSNQLG